VGKPTLWPEWPGIVAIASDSPQALPAELLAGGQLGVLDLADAAAMASWVLAHATER
jgi:hypothetical protein